MTAATIRIKPPMAISGIIVNGTSLLATSSCVEGFLILFIFFSVVVSSGMSSGLIGGLRVVAVVSGTVEVLDTSIYSVVAMVLLGICGVNFGISGMLG